MSRERAAKVARQARDGRRQGLLAQNVRESQKNQYQTTQQIGMEHKSACATANPTLLDDAGICDSGFIREQRTPSGGMPINCEDSKSLQIQDLA